MTPDANELCIFAVKRGNIEGRLDVRNLKYKNNHRDQKTTTATLGSLTIEEPCYGTSATAIERTDDSQPKYIRITDFDDFGIEGGHEFKAAEDYSEKHILKAGDILFARTGGTVGKTYYYDGSIGKAVFAGYCIRFRFDEKKVLPRFIYWYTKTSIYQRWVNGIQRPSGQPNINKEEYKSFRIILPDLKRQEKLCDDINNAETRRKRKLQQADELICSICHYIHSVLKMDEVSNDKPIMFITKRRNFVGSRFDPEYHNPFFSRRIAEISKTTFDVLDNVIEFSFETWNQKDYFVEDFPYIEISNVSIKGNQYTVSYVRVLDAPSRAKMIVRNGDIIVSTTRPHRGAIATIQCPENDILVASTGFCVLRDLKRSDVLKEYLQWILLDDYVLLQMLQRSSGGNYPAINAEELKKIVIPIPNIKIQRMICEEAQNRKAKADTLRKEAEREWLEAKAQFERELLGE